MDITRELSGLTDRFVAYRFVRLIEEGKLDMSRLEEKLARAGGVVVRQAAKIEAEADALIAREAKIEQRTSEAFAPHHAILDGQQKGLDALERKLDLLSNDPLGSSGAEPPTAPAPVDYNQQTNPPNPPIARDWNPNR